MNASEKQINDDASLSGDRNADRTRSDLLIAAAREMHLRGFQAASLSNILIQAGVTKGALYHHFPSKKILGYAVVDEIWALRMHSMWIEPLADVKANPLDVITQMIESTGASMSDGDLNLGCPINNISQEMSPIDEGFRNRVNTLLADWRHGISQALFHGNKAGFVNDRVPFEIAATFIVASLQGCIGIAKNAQSKDSLIQCGMGVIDYLNTLRS